MKRRIAASDVRERLEAADRAFAAKYAPLLDEPEVYRSLIRRAEALAAGRPVIVRHGWEIDLPPSSGPFVVEADGTVAAVEPVYADVTAPVLTCVGYRRVDGSLVER